MTWLLLVIALPSLVQEDLEEDFEEDIEEEGFFDKIEFSIFLELEGALQFYQPYDQKLDVLLRPEVVIPFSEDVKLKAIGRFRFDAADEIEPGKPSLDTYSPISQRFLLADIGDFELREFWLGFPIGKFYFRIGKQQIVWGEADGLKVLDVINPQSFREFILDEFNDSRIPLWSFLVEIAFSTETTLRLIWIPDQTYHELPDVDGLFAFAVPEPPAGVGLDVEDIERPDRFFLDSDFGFRLSTFWKGFDLSLSYFYHYDDFPVLFQELTITGLGPVLRIVPKYERTHLVGGTLSNAFGEFTIRAEIGGWSSRYFATEPGGSQDGFHERAELAYVLGVDWRPETDLLFSVQIFQSWIIGSADDLIRDTLDTSITAAARWTFHEEMFTLKVQIIHNVNQSDGLVRLRLDYQMIENWKIWLGGDLFYGNDDGLFGQFDERDRLYVGTQLTF